MNTAVLVMLINYAHDLATGLLFGSIVGYFLATSALTRARDPEERASLRVNLYARFKPVVLLALALVLLGGIPRMIFYEEYEWLPAAGRGQVTALVVKHLVLVTVTVLSLVAFFRKRPISKD